MKLSMKIYCHIQKNVLQAQKISRMSSNNALNEADSFQSGYRQASHYFEGDDT